MHQILIATFIVSLLGCSVDAATGAEVAISRPGRVVGRVIVAGVVPKSQALQVFKSRSFCGAAVPNETLLVNSFGGLRNAVVILRPIAKSASAPPRQAELDNQRCAFTPHVQIVTTGSDLLLKNSDPILHTVHARLGRETLFNVGLPTWRRVTKRLDRPGAVRIDCDVLHTWMSAVVYVSDSPHGVVTDGQGEFVIENLTAGDYELEVWHERLGQQRQRIIIKEAATADIDVIYQAPR